MPTTRRRSRLSTGSVPAEANPPLNLNYTRTPGAQWVSLLDHMMEQSPTLTPELLEQLHQNIINRNREGVRTPAQQAQPVLRDAANVAFAGINAMTIPTTWMTREEAETMSPRWPPAPPRHPPAPNLNQLAHAAHMDAHGNPLNLYILREAHASVSFGFTEPDEIWLNPVRFLEFGDITNAQYESNPLNGTLTLMFLGATVLKSPEIPIDHIILFNRAVNGGRVPQIATMESTPSTVIIRNLAIPTATGPQF